jgi:hypothetical protein
MTTIQRLFVPAAILVSLATLGCRSPYYSDRGALAGGLAGAGIGAAIGDASGAAGPGAIIGAALGTLTGNAIGEGIDADLARSKAEIEARMGRQMSGAVSNEDVIAMTQAGLSEDVIATHIRAHGVARPPAVNDLIILRNQGVSDRVIQALQQTPPPTAAAVPVSYAVGPPRAVLVEPYYCPPPPPHFYFHHGHRHRHHHHHGSGVRWGFSFSD